MTMYGDTNTALNHATDKAARCRIDGQRWVIIIVLVGAFTVAGLLAATGPSPAQGAPTVAAGRLSQATIVRCDPSTLNAVVGATVSVTIFVQDVVDLYGLDVHLVFDPAHAQVVDADPAAVGVQIQPLSGFLSPDFVIRRSADNATGLVRYAATQVSPSQPVSGSGAVVRIDLRGTQPGAIPVPITQIELARSDGSTIPATSQACTWQFSQRQMRYLPLVTAP